MVIPSIPLHNCQTFLRGSGSSSAGGGGSAPIGFDELVALSPISLIHATGSEFWQDTALTVPANTGDTIAGITNAGRGADFVALYGANAGNSVRLANGAIDGNKNTQQSQLQNTDTTSGPGWVVGTTEKLITWLVQKVPGYDTTISISVGNTSTNGHHMTVYESMVLASGGGSTYQYSQVAADNTWYIVQVIDDGVNTKYFIDDVEVKSYANRVGYNRNTMFICQSYSRIYIGGVYLGDDPQNRSTVYEAFSNLRLTL